MIESLWGNFPRLLEQNVNGLLEDARPTALRAFQIYRALQHEGLWAHDIQRFSKCVEQFFARPRSERRKANFDFFLDRPMEHSVFALFHLDFRTAAVSDQAIRSVASWAHHVIRVSKKSEAAYLSFDVMLQTIRRLVNPSRFEKARDLEFVDFCGAWKKTVFKIFGSAHDREFGDLLRELAWIDAELKRRDEEEALQEPLRPLAEAWLYLTQTELDWTEAVREAALSNTSAPNFPLARGPEKASLRELERVARLHTSSLSSRHPEIVKNRERIRVTLLERAESVLGRTMKLVG